MQIRNRKRREGLFANAGWFGVGSIPRGAPSAGRVRRAALSGTALLALAAMGVRANAAGPTTQFSVGGVVVSPQSFTLSGLQALPATTLPNVTFLSGTTPVTGSFTGVSLWTLLNNVTGIKTDATVKNDVLREFVIATGSDGYQTVLSMGEVNPSFGGSATAPDLVAYANNGKLLTSDGFARTVVPGDSKGGRYVSNLASLNVFHAPVQTGTFGGGTTNQFTVIGNVTAPATYNMNTLQALPATSVTVSGVSYTGVNLWTLLNKSGVVTNPQIKNDILLDYVVATGSDGYQSVISLGEIDPDFGNNPDLVAYAMNGGSLGVNGFARLVVPNDSKQGCWMSNLTNLEVFDATLWTANTNELVDLTALNINAMGFHLNGGTLTSSGGAGVLTVPQATLDGGLIDTNATVQSPNTVTQSSGMSILKGTIDAPNVAITGGRLQLAGGMLTGSASVSSGATLGSGGAIGGSLTFAPGSTFAVNVAQTASDQLAVKGAASLAGAVQVTAISAGPYKVGASYQILAAGGGLIGQFNTLSTIGSFANWITPSLVYKANEVDLSLDPKMISSQISNPTRNQAAVAASVDAILLTKNAPQSFLNLFNLPGSSVPAALSGLSGEAATGVQTSTLRAGSTFLNILLNPDARTAGGETIANTPALAYADGPQPSAGGKAIDNLADRKSAPAPLDGAWSVWGTAFAGTQSVGGDSRVGSSGITDRAAGLAVGADMRVGSDFILGFGIAGGGTSFSLDGGLGSATGDLFQAGVYASKTLGSAYVSGAAAYTWNSTTMTRAANNVGLTQTLTSNPLGQAFGGRLEAGFRTAFFGTTPYAAIEAQSYNINAFSETSSVGAPALGLSYLGSSAASVRSELGMRWENVFDMSSTMGLALSGRLAWAHEYEGVGSISALFQSAPISPFKVIGAATPSDAALITVGAELRMNSGFRFFAKADAEIAANANAIRGDLGVRYLW